NGGRTSVARNSKSDLPLCFLVGADGVEGSGKREGYFASAPFRFCLNCGVAYNARQTSDFGKLAALGSEGRSTATTILSLSAIRHMRDSGLDAKAQKLLSFTDNRQDASLQAGHFNDFIEVGLLRGALYKAVQDGKALEHYNVTQAVFKAMGLDQQLYAKEPAQYGPGKSRNEASFQRLLEYRLY